MDHLIRHLKTFGLSRQEGLVYAYLLQYGRLTVQQLLRASKVVPQELELSLERISHFCLISEVSTDDKRSFRAVDPKLSWQAFGYSTLWQTAETATRPFNHNAGEDPRLQLIHMIGDAAQALYQSKSAKSFRYRNTYESMEEFSLDCGQALMTAQNEVIASEISPRRLQASLFWPSIVSMRERGVGYTRYCDIDEVCLHGIEVVTRDVREMKINILVVPRHVHRRSFYIVDGLVMFLHNSSNNQGNNFSAACSWNNGLIERYLTEKIPTLHAQAISFEELRADIEENIEQKRSEITRKLRAVQHESVFDKIVNLGKFAPLSTSEKKSADELVSLRVLKKTEEGYCISLDGHPRLEHLERH